jgi:uncharacterized Zn finger protein
MPLVAEWLSPQNQVKRIVALVRQVGGLMTRDDAALKDWCRSRIHDRYREAYRLTLEVGLQAQEKEDLSTLAQTMDSLDSAIEVLERARRELVAV